MSQKFTYSIEKRKQIERERKKEKREEERNISKGKEEVRKKAGRKKISILFRKLYHEYLF